MDQKIRESKYNIRYKSSKSIGTSEYLIKMENRGSQKMIARLRYGNEEERNGYLKMGEKKRCCVYGLEKGYIEHILIHTRNKIGVNVVVSERERREAVRWMREIKKLRKIHRRGIESVRVCECD